MRFKRKVEIKGCCGKKSFKFEHVANSVPGGDIIEALEETLSEKLQAQRAALKNWMKLGLRIQII